MQTDILPEVLAEAQRHVPVVNEKLSIGVRHRRRQHRLVMAAERSGPQKLRAELRQRQSGIIKGV